MIKFEYLRPTSLEEAISLVAKYGDKAKVCAGGTDLIVKMRQKVLKPSHVVNIGSLAGLDYISYDNSKGLRIGALTTIRSIEKSSELREKGYGMLCHAASQMASGPVRNVATVGGNLCNAAPSADMAPGLIALSGKARIVGSGGERIIPLEDFFTGPGFTVLDADELLVEIQIPPLSSPCSGGAYFKHSIRGTVDLAIVGVAASLTLDSTGNLCEDARIVLGAVAPTPLRVHKAEDVLKGKNLKDDLIDEAARVASEEAHPISDVRSSAEYRSKMVAVFTRKALKAALEEAKSKESGLN